MLPKRRPSAVTSLTGDREAKKLGFQTALRRAERRCGQASQRIAQVTSQGEGGSYRMRSKGSVTLTFDWNIL